MDILVAPDDPDDVFESDKVVLDVLPALVEGECVVPVDVSEVPLGHFRQVTQTEQNVHDYILVDESLLSASFDWVSDVQVLEGASVGKHHVVDLHGWKYEWNRGGGAHHISHHLVGDSLVEKHHSS